MTASAPCPVMSDRDIVESFATGRLATHSTSCGAMRRFLNGNHTADDLERLRWFVTKRAEEFPITAAAVQRLLNGG